MIVTETNRTARYTLEDGRSNHEYTRTFLVQGVSNLVGALSAASAVGISLGDPYQISLIEYDNYAFATSIEASGTSQNGSIYEVNIAYGKMDADYAAENPLDQKPVVSWDTAKFTRPVDESPDGTPIVNSAGLPFDPSIERDESRPILRIVRNECLTPTTNPTTGDPYPLYNAAWAFSFVDTINSDSFAGGEPNQVKLESISAQRSYDPLAGSYMQTSYEFAYSQSETGTWEKKILDCGLMELGDDGKYVWILDESGTPVSQPVPLDDGHPIAAPVDSSSVGYITYQVYPESDFSVFGFDPSLF